MTIKSLLAQGKHSNAFCLPTLHMDDAIELMSQLDVNAVCIIDTNGNALGILTDHDILRAIHSRGSTGNSINDERVANWMSEYICGCNEETSLLTAASIMTRNNIHHLVVTHSGKPVAVISLTDVLALMHDNDEKELIKIRSGLVTQATSAAA